eukprot:g3674.t1
MMTSILVVLAIVLSHSLQGCRGEQSLLDKTLSSHIVKKYQEHPDVYSKENKDVIEVRDATNKMQPLSNNVLPLPPGAAEFDTLSSSNILMKHKCFSPQYCVSKERSKEFSLRTLQLWGTKVQSFVDTSVDRVLQNVSTWYTTDDCIPLHIFIHGILVVLDRGLNPANVFTTALEATLQCKDFVNISTRVNERTMIHESKKEVSTNGQRLLAQNASKRYHHMNSGTIPISGSRGRRLNSCPQVSSQCATTITVSTETDLKNAVTTANNGGTSTYVQVSQNISFSGEMQSDSALYISSATIAIVGQGGMKELKRSSGGDYRIFYITGSSSKVYLENLTIANGY